MPQIPRKLVIVKCCRSGRSAAWLARLVRDQEVEGSNPFAPTIFLPLFLEYFYTDQRTGVNSIGIC